MGPVCATFGTLNTTHHSKSLELERQCYGYRPSSVGRAQSAVCGLRLSDADCSEATEHDGLGRIVFDFALIPYEARPPETLARQSYSEALTLSIRSRRCLPLSESVLAFPSHSFYCPGLTLASCTRYIFHQNT